MTTTRHHTATIIACTILVLGLSTGGLQAQMSIDEEYNIAELMTIAEQTYDLANEDAVLLLDGLRQEWSIDGKLTTVRHQIVWISTEYGIEEFADLRVPYDHQRCFFNVTTIRTWRDGQWWVTGETGIVETLPYALSQAYDYTNMREMMLLHDGIEIPCILEVAYSIEDKQPFRTGTEGLWTFAREVPTVRSKFELEVPSGFQQPYVASDDVPAPITEQSASGESDIYTWETGPVAALPLPHTADEASDVPHVTWSTWSDWAGFGAYLSEKFVTAAFLEGGLSDAIDSLITESRTESELTKLIADFVSDHVHYIEYSEQYCWPSPRHASRVYETGYGHRLDRAILAAAMFKAAGLDPSPIFVAKEYGKIGPTAPTLARFDGIGVAVLGTDRAWAYYDPSEGSIANAPLGVDISRATQGPLLGRTLWIDFEKTTPTFGEDRSSVIQVRLDFSLNEAKDSLIGEGFYSSAGLFNSYDKMQGLSGEAEEYLGSLVGGMLDGAEVSLCNPVQFDGETASFGFAVALKLPDSDDQGRIPLIIGEPKDGLIDRLPDHVNLYDQHRESSVRFPGPLSQVLDIRLDLDGLEVMYAPEEMNTADEKGTFSVEVSRDAERLAMNRKLHLEKNIYPLEEWPALRALLLLEAHERNQTILLKLGEDTEN